jgi:ABC-type antimicrobial peptide transport system permease subunit
MSIDSLRGAKWRSFLTMLGIIIGVVSVLTIVGIGEGVKNQVNAQINELGKDLITVRAGQEAQSSTGNLGGLTNLLSTASYGSLSQQDLQSVQQTAGVKLAVPLGVVSGAIQVGQTTDNNVSVIATSSDLPTILQQPLAYGDFFNSDTSIQPNVAVLGPGAAEALFHEKIPLGNSFTYLGQTFVVRGIFNQFDTDPLSLSTNFNDAIFIPYATAQALTNNNVPLSEVLARPVQSTKTSATVKAITSNLVNAHQNQEQFTVLRQDESLMATNKILNLLTKLVAGVAAISLLVGGVGIMDVMLVSVAERMHEIGIRKALGATNRQILAQFLTEATVLSLTGGIIGIIAAYIIDFLLNTFTSLTPFIPWQVVVLATAVSLFVGIGFGSIPALKAARKDPIDALRNE